LSKTGRFLKPAGFFTRKPAGFSLKNRQVFGKPAGFYRKFCRPGAYGIKIFLSKA
jgi:hypothetical protein